MKTKRSLVFISAILLVSIALIVSASAQKITGSIGNSRMVLRLEHGELVQKSILVKNVNDVQLNIDVSVSGDLADYIELDETSFNLSAGEEKKVYFTIKAAKGGTTESKVNIRFSPETGNGVGLSSTIIVITSGEDDTMDEPADDSDNSDSGFTFNPSGTSVPNSETQKIHFSSLTLLLISTAVLIIAFAALMFYYSRKKSKKGLGRPRE